MDSVFVIVGRRKRLFPAAAACTVAVEGNERTPARKRNERERRAEGGGQKTLKSEIKIERWRGLMKRAMARNEVKIGKNPKHQRSIAIRQQNQDRFCDDNE